MTARSDFEAQAALYMAAAGILPSVRVLPAAAVPRGSVLLLEREEGGPRSPVTVLAIANATPRVGRLTWTTPLGPVEIGAATDVEVVSLP